ncbi:ABC transporter ATP-binding protein [Methylobacterium dankookense]|uniref:Spermidine/putrescine import ATP-binding protein PotA n=1 Tax=Methylobacterium dankookense TaxID=560405 RepID=A0A564FY50_9HYPH|nr:ABC transporter ATP-binding protein [Methylobacterium dankookense]GJD59228.1 Vitamin B12 import ATP-binding protein BtuD [Methylobacterium dankookense]VUF13085.1 Spermidine/putrescine import ATP-binding protein PotA [Methylobacterium dankookense]
MLSKAVDLSPPANLPGTAPSPRPAPAVRLDGVVKRFGTVTALEETWLQVEQGEFLTLLGPSGCGKTTLLNLMAGFLEADAGEIFIGGDLVTATPPYERQIGIVFQNYALFPHMSVAKNVGYGLRMRGVGKREIAERVGQALDLVKLSGLADRSPRQLSGGQQQRVALARALVIRPKVLLLDEPFSALDKNLRGAMQVELKEIQRRLGVTTVFVTHDQGEALSMSDRIVVMSAGRIRQIGTPDQVYRHPQDRFVAGFIGDVNRLPARLEACAGERATVTIRDLRREVEAGALRDCAPGAAVDVFVRPDHLTLRPAGEPGTLPARVAALVYQGSHIDLHADLDLSATEGASAGGRVVVRMPGQGALATHAPGTEIGLLVPQAGLVAFPPEG